MTGFNETLARRWEELEARRAEEERRRREDRVRVIITVVSEPEPDNPADFMYLQVKASGRLRHAMEEFQSRFPLYRDTFTEAPSNFLTRHGPQLVITEEALSEVTGHWGAQDWRDGDGIRRDWIEWAMDDFIHGLSGYHALVQWA